MLTIDDLPDAKYTAAGAARQAQPLTMPNVHAVLGHMGVTLGFNMMRASVAYRQDGAPVPPAGEGRIYQNLCDLLVRLDINALGRLDEILLELAQGAPFHPMEDAIRGVEWDGHDHITDLAASIVTDTPLWAVYLENWLVQVVQGVCGWRRAKQSLPHVLVLVGGQGVGKTQWLQRLGGDFIKTEAELHLASAAGKDHQIEALQWPMVELSELDGVFRKSDISHMKAFISRDFDAIREPYGRRAIRRPRVTAFCGSVNDAEFLNDPSGSRRFWPVSVDAIDWTYRVPWAQLWAQALAYWSEVPAFDLTPAQDRIRAATALDRHSALLPEIEYLAAYWAAHRGLGETYRAMNASEVLHMLGYRNPWVQTVAAAKGFLFDNIGKHRTIEGKQRCWMFPFSEFGANPAAWPLARVNLSDTNQVKTGSS